MYLNIARKEKRRIDQGILPTRIKSLRFLLCVRIVLNEEKFQKCGANSWKKEEEVGDLLA